MKHRPGVAPLFLPAMADEKITASSPRTYHPGSWLLYWAVIKPVSLLPYFILYGLSDFLFLVIWYVMPYRKKVVLSNLRRVFPDRSERELRKLAWRFYRHFADLVAESLKNFSITPAQAGKRMDQQGAEVLNRFAREGRSIILCGGHQGNWELWAMAAPIELRHILLGVYKRLSNPFFDRKMRESRSRYGLVLVPTIETGTYLRSHPEEVNCLILAIDQSPANPQKAIWIDFLGQDTAVYFGAERYAVQFDRPVVFGSIYKVRRGYYEVRYELVTDTPAEHPEGFITREVFRRLEANILAQPEYWLWSHKRWKHRRSEG